MIVRPSVIKSYDGLRPILNNKYENYIAKQTYHHFMQDQGTSNLPITDYMKSDDILN